MTEKLIVKKVTGGKLFKLFLKGTKDSLEELTLTGDFFLHPEYVIDLLESGLKEAFYYEQKELGIEKINEILEQEHAELIGVTSEDLIEALLEGKNEF